MKIKVFAFQKGFFASWDLPTNQMEPEIQDWLAKNPRIKVHEIKHDLVQGIFIAPQLVVSIYYSDAEV